MITKNAEQIFKKHAEVQHYLNQVVRSMNPEKVILFGSKATGLADHNSATDLAVVTNQIFDTTEIYGAVDIIDYKNTTKKLKEIIQKEGIVLYER
ncbi:MAG: nucleotidyltransferase domain-containing protein [Chitinophagales bacterium]|nr:nucleotidyltransferase domain-containing protein [Chitinophagales bacterium]